MIPQHKAHILATLRRTFAEHGENFKAIQSPSQWSESGEQQNTAHDNTLQATAPRQRGSTATMRAILTNQSWRTCMPWHGTCKPTAYNCVVHEQRERVLISVIQTSVHTDVMPFSSRRDADAAPITASARMAYLRAAIFADSFRWTFGVGIDYYDFDACESRSSTPTFVHFVNRVLPHRGRHIVWASLSC